MMRPIESVANTPVNPIDIAPRGLFESAPAPRKNDIHVAETDPLMGALGDSVLVQGGFAELTAHKEAINQLASESRTIGEVSRLINRARQGLDGIVKQFPPFPPGSMEREQYLNSVAGIRAVIQQLTIPRELGPLLDNALSGAAFTDAGSTDAEMQAGLNTLNNVDASLASTRARLGDALAPAGEVGANDAFYLTESRRIGQELMRQNASISHDPKTMRGLLG